VKGIAEHRFGFGISSAIFGGAADVSLKGVPMPQETHRPLRIGVYETVAQVQAALSDLREAGFTSREISVVCSDEASAAHFPQYRHEEPAGTHTDDALSRAGLTGLGLGTAAILSALVTSAGTAVFVAGAFAGLAAVGTFAATMMTRGAEQELADYYDQAVVHGKLLVAVETSDPRRHELAARILATHEPEQSGSLPVED
jgi:hypothetical protein